MKKFKGKWDRRGVQDDGSYMSKEAKQFVSDFRSMLKRELSPIGIEVLNIRAGHYSCSGFLKKDDHYIYISYSIPRSGYPINFSSYTLLEKVLYRSAQNDKDYRGGANNFCSLEKLPASITLLFTMMEKEAQQ